MPESIEEFASRARAAQGEDGRLRLDEAGMPLWDIFPFEAESMQVKPLRAPGEELPRAGEPGGPECPCQAAGASDDPHGWRVVWTDRNWQVKTPPPSGSPLVLVLEPQEHVDLDELRPEMAGEFGVRTIALVRAVESLPSVGRCHVSRWGDGGAHAHVWFIARPLGMSQMRGTFMAIWDDLLPPVPLKVRDANLAAALAHFDATLAGPAGGGPGR